MGNCFRRCFEADSHSEPVAHGGYGGQGAAGGAGGPADVDFTAVAPHLFEFETTNKVPDLLGYYVSASKATQRIWFAKLLAAWKRANPAPATAEAVAVLIIQTLQGYHGIKDLLSFYKLPWPTLPVSQPLPEETEPEAGEAWLVEPDAAELIQFEIQTLPIKWNANAGDGDGFTAFVDVNEDAREAQNLPETVKEAVKRRRRARAQNNFHDAKAFQKQITDANYKVFDGKNGGASCLARKYRIRLRGVDAPEIDQPYGEEARDVLRGLVKDQQLVIHVYEFDKYDRAVGDVYCHGKLIQEEILKRGSVMYYEYHDKRAKFAKWERAAKEAGLGLWADANPEKPWEHRYKQKHPHMAKRGSFRKKTGA